MLAGYQQLNIVSINNHSGMKRRLLIVILISSVVASYAQRPMSIKIKDPVVCYANAEDHPFEIAAPEVYMKWKKGHGARVKTTNIIVDYVNFPENANGIGPKACFQTAVDIWESFLSDIGTAPQTIRVEARWTSLAPNVLGSALYTAAYANFKGAQKLNVFYPVAMAEKISGQELNDGEPDLFANFNSNFNWHLNPDVGSAIPSGQHDLITVVLHELAHGLGFAGTFTLSGTNGQYGLNGTETPIIYDVPIENGSNQNLIQSFPTPSPDLRPQLISANLFFDSPTAARPKLYVPATFNGGSSISHLDEIYNATQNALMTFSIAAQERLHSPGIALNMLKDMGWETVRINHQQYAGSETVTGSYNITASIQADVIGYITNTVKLHYTLDGTNFTVVNMTATGNPNEYTAAIPSTGSADEYGYFISVLDNATREFVNPGKIVREGQAELQNLFFFETGPDNQAPKVAHSPKGFILKTDTQLKIDAEVSDNLGVEFVTVEYYKNENLVGSANMLLASPPEDSIYSATLNLTGLNLQAEDKIKYRIVATDVSVIGNPNGNIGYSPSASTFHIVNVVGLEPTQDFYENNFNAASNDFFGNGFSITAPSGFTDPAIHTTHPYLQGDGLPGDALHLIYQLKIPIRVKAQDATIKFDEIVLVEPGEAGSVFGSENFFDYVVVEASKDGGITWTAVANGYDSRDNSAWLTRYNSAIVGNNSNATGDPALFRSRTLDLQLKFDTNEEVVIRFRLYSDPFAAGWGWAIDNLKIQVDDTPPLILHNHVDYLFDADDVISLTSKVSDASGIKGYKLEYFVNNGAVVTEVFDIDPPQTEYPFSITGLSALAVGDVFNYRFVATDNFDRQGTFPPTGFIQVPIIQFTTPVTTYANNFNTVSTDFVGNFFTIYEPAGFTNQAIHSMHFYGNGIGLNNTSVFTYTLKKPIKISSQNSYLRFDEIALVEGHPGNIVFGSPGFKDYVIVEGSKNGGTTWLPLLNGYDIVGQADWVTAFTNQSSGTPAMFKQHTVDLVGNGNFVANDNVVIRFRMFVDETINGWGWAIDNLYIQDPITATEKEFEVGVNVYPNPAKGNITVEATGVSSSYLTIQLMDTQGKNIYRATQEISNGKMSHTIEGRGIPAGMYFVKISDGIQSTIKKLVKLD